jgi:hypothetical protein
MVRVTKIYHYPGHADRLFGRVLREHVSRGMSLRRVDKGYFLGNGITLRLEFDDVPDSADFRMVHFYGRRRPDTYEAFAGWSVFAVLPMRAWWMTIGYFYVLRRVSEADLPNRCRQQPPRLAVDDS